MCIREKVVGTRAAKHKTNQLVSSVSVTLLDRKWSPSNVASQAVF